MTNMSISVPDNLDLTELELKMTLASRLYETKRLSLGQAADMAEVSKRTFIELLGRYGISLFNQTYDEVSEDIANA